MWNGYQMFCTVQRYMWRLGQEKSKALIPDISLSFVKAQFFYDGKNK